MDRTYETAVSIIDGRWRPARPSATTPILASGQSKATATGPRGSPSLLGMSEWLQQLGHSPSDINALNVIHVAGTKGKGSTCAFSEAILRAHGKRTGFPAKTGLYTSPHLMRPEERIRINSQPLSEQLFAKYFFEIYDGLPQIRGPYDTAKEPFERGPRFLQLYALFALHVFIREAVDVTILETHNGGEYDATNVVQKPLVTAVSTLGMDHVEMLGPTLENISWHKAGIYKSGATALSAIQEPSAAAVLKSRAAAKGESVQFVDIDPRLPIQSVKLKPAVQKQNCSLAVAAVQSFLDKRLGSGARLDEEDIAQGVDDWIWPGRFQIVPDGRSTWFLDAAHNEMSVPIAAQWFSETSKLTKSDGQHVVNILIFSHINELRDAVGLLDSLAKSLRDADSNVTHVIFSTYDESAVPNLVARPAKDTSVFHEAWNKILPGTHIWDEPTIQGAMERSRRIGQDHDFVHTLITGSQHLVGPALRILEARASEG